jgi:hypothetical protein
MYPIKSLFSEISEWAFTTTDLSIAKSDTIKYVLESKINETDKKRIIYSLNECKTIHKFHCYISNSLLKYEGLGLGLKLDRLAKQN